MIDWNKLSIGDEVKVEYTTGDQFKGGTIKGKITKLILGETSEEWNKKGNDGKWIGRMWMGQVDNGWCFHPRDILLYHRKAS